MADIPGDAGAPRAVEMMDWFRRSEIERAIGACDSLYASAIFTARGTQNPLFEAAVTQLLVFLSDLLQKARIMGQRIAATDDVVVGKGVTDLTDLVCICRDAACHVSSGHHRVDASMFTVNVIAGRVENAIVVGGIALGCPYEDDIAIFFGRHRFLLNRNGTHALAEAKRILLAAN